LADSQTKTALIADDDSAIRGMLGRLLRPLGWNVIEAGDGCSAIEKLSTCTVDLAILDQRMPQLTGLEVLSIIRQSDTHADLPVMIVSGACDVETSETMLGLGIVDYLVKPLRPEFVRDRLTRMNRLVRAAASNRRARGQDRPKDGSVLIVVDADAEFRSFVSTVLMHRYEVIEVASGVAALRTCLVSKPSIFVLGSNVGLMTPEFLARKLRERRDLTDIRIVLVTAQIPARDAAAFDGVLPRTFVPAEFSEQFDRIFAPSFHDDGDILGGVRKTIEGATEQAIGMMAGTAIVMARGDERTIVPGQMQASVDVQLETERLAFRLLLRCSPEHARAIGALMLGLPVDGVSDEDGLATLGELSNIIAGRVKTSMVSNGGRAAFSLPQLAADGGDEPSQPSDAVLTFAPDGGAFNLAIVMQLLPRRPAVRAASHAASKSTASEQTLSA
jgi:DNA-binding response OmpR family regulator